MQVKILQKREHDLPIWIALDERGTVWIEGIGITVKEVVIDKVVWRLTPEEL